MLAIADHDDGQQPIRQTQYLTEAGAPAHFKMQTLSMEQMHKVTRMAECKGQWVALLISKHMLFLYGDKRGESKELAAFLEAQEQKQKQWINALQVTHKEVDLAYALLQWCDQLSLVLSQRHLPAGERKLEISAGPDGNVHFIYQRKNNTLCVEPWPFQDKEFTVGVEASYLTQLHFKDDKELDNALEKAPVKTLQWVFKK